MRIREPNIIEYLPLFMQEHREVKEVMTSENPEFQLTAIECEIIKDNQFIVSCDSKGIKRFEKILNISATEQEPLQSRVARVLNRWNDTVPYTFEGLIEKLEVLCGIGDFTIIKKFNEYKIEIETHLDKYGEVDELQYLFQYIMPGNIEIVSRNNFYFTINAKAEIAMGMAFVNFFELSNDFNESFSLNASAIAATGLVKCGINSLTNDFNETYTLKNEINFGGSNIGTVECVITDNFQETVNITSDSKTGAGIDFVSIITT